MNKTGASLLFFTAGAAIGAFATYIATSEKKEEWFNEASRIVAKIKHSIKEKKEEIGENIEDEIENILDEK